MLPLWIIDLRKKSDRRDLFESLVGQIDHVCIAKVCDSTNDSSDETSNTNNSTGSSKEGPQSYGDNYFTPDSTIKEQLDALDRQEADKNSIIEGKYWRYSQLGDCSYDVTIDGCRKKAETGEIEDQLNDAEKTAKNLYKFQCDLVEEGQEFIKDLRNSNVHPDIKINVAVLGDLTEDFTRIVFPAIAGILQKEKGRILPHHIHQGMEIIGMLFIPSDINTRKVSIRKSMQLTLKEIDVQHCVNDIRGYDHMMFYQDVQNRTECTYPMLNDEQLAQYLVQCLVHLYLACNDSHPLLSGTTSADVFYFSMGAASVHFDTENEDLKSRYKLAIDIIRSFKSEGKDEKVNEKLNLINENEYEPVSFFKYEELSKLNYNDIEEDEPSPHPIRNYLSKFLKRYYYNQHLKFFAVNLHQRIINQIDNCTRSSLEHISTNSKKRFTDAQKSLFERLVDIIGQISANDGGVPTIIRLFKDMQESLSNRKKDIQPVLKQKFWRKIEETYVGKSMIDSFIDYHEAYNSDIKNKTGGSNQLELKKQAVTELNGILSEEATMLSRICRCILAGIMCALAIVPILHIISPDLINLGRIRRYGELWSIGLFILPALFQFISYFRYNRKKKKAINHLKALYLHDAFARVANRIEFEINSFYDKMISLGDKYIARCEDIRKEVGKDYKEDEQGKALFPESMFNQPLIGGAFGREKLLPEKEADDAEVRINYIRYKLSELTKVEFFLFINQNRNIIKELFKDVTLCENLIRRINDNEEEELITKEQQEKEQKDTWRKQRDLFHDLLRDTVKDALQKREDSTVGEKLNHYCSVNSDKAAVLKPMIAYAATNGEVISSADMEYTDAKMNDKRVAENIMPYISSASNQMQSDKYNIIYKKYIFVTRWRCFDHFNLNRILPTEDFDEKVRSILVYEEETMGKKEDKTGKGKRKEYRSTEEEKIKKPHEKGKVYKPHPSSLLLWSLCPDDSSSEWFRLFDSEFFAEAYEDKNVYRKTLNQDD